MKPIRVRSDYTVELPEELRSEIHPGDTLEVAVIAGNVVYLRPAKTQYSDLRRIIELVRKKPPITILSEDEIEDIVHQARRVRL